MPCGTATAEPVAIAGIIVDGSQNILYLDDVKSLNVIGFYNNHHHQHQFVAHNIHINTVLAYGRQLKNGVDTK